MGGLIAAELALLAPQRIRSLALCATFAGYLQGPPPNKTNLRTMLSTCEQLILPKSLDEKVNHTLKMLYSDTFLKTDNNRELIFDYQCKRHEESIAPLSGIVGHHKTIFSHNMSTARLQDLRDQGFPILIVGAGNDALLHPGHSQWLYEALEAPHTRLVYYPQSGHAVYMECANQLSDDVLQHILD
jgi:pimeloyl-ACP methyl ester carboxylesterase